MEELVALKSKACGPHIVILSTASLLYHFAGRMRFRWIKWIRFGTESTP
jgi:hypothetical protein